MLPVETAVEDVAVLMIDDGVDRPDEIGSAMVCVGGVFTHSIVLIVAARRGVGKGLKVDMSHVDFDFFGVGRGDIGVDEVFEDDETLDLIDTLSSSLSLGFSSDFPLPIIPHQPEGLVCTSNVSVFFGSISPRKTRDTVSPHVHPCANKFESRTLNLQPIFRIAILKVFQFHLYFPPCMLRMTRLTSSSLAFAFFPR